MYIDKISFDSAENHDRMILEPSVDDIVHYIGLLNGETNTIVTLETLHEAHMGIGGGNFGLYILYATFDNVNFFNLIDRSKEGSPIILTIGGQDGQYPIFQCNSKIKVLEAAIEFALNGKLLDKLDWQKDEFATS